MPNPSILPGSELGLVHNKGVVIDGKTSWISSMNWGPTSALENREVGVLVESPFIGTALRKAFFIDWGLTLVDEISIQKQGWTVVPDNDTWVTATLTLSINAAPGLKIALFDGSIQDAFDCRSIDWTICPECEVTTLVYNGPVPSSGGLLILVTDGDRTAYLSEQRIEAPETPSDGGWDYPLYKDPLFPLFLMVAIPILVSVCIAIYRSRKEPRRSGQGEE
jgi:hypothetical protein